MSEKAYAYLKGSGEEPKLKKASEELYYNKDQYIFRCSNLACNCIMIINKRSDTIYFSSNKHIDNCENYQPGSSSKKIKIGDPVLSRSIFKDKPKTPQVDIEENAKITPASQSAKKDPSCVDFSDEPQELKSIQELILFLSEVNIDERSIIIDENTSIPCRDLLITDANYDNYRSLRNLDGVHLLINPMGVVPKNLGLSRSKDAVYCSDRQPHAKKNDNHIYFEFRFTSKSTRMKFQDAYYAYIKQCSGYSKQPSANLIILGDFKKIPDEKLTIYQATISDQCFATEYTEDELPDQLLIKR